jgi:hypothetical protein
LLIFFIENLNEIFLSEIMITNKQIFNYIASLFIISWAIQLIGLLVTGDVNSDDVRVWLAITILSPLFVTIFYLKDKKSLEKVS